MTKVQALSFLINFIIIFKNLLVYAIIARVIMSWFTMGQSQMGSVSRFLHGLTDPVINLAKKIPHQIGMIDLSPLIALFALDLVGQLLVGLLAKLA